eukprot:scaffold17386_cov63-Phaeocystis_antarctica.AAC.1
MIIRQPIFRFLGVIFDGDHEFGGPRSPIAHLDTVLRKPVTPPGHPLYFWNRLQFSGIDHEAAVRGFVILNSSRYNQAQARPKRTQRVRTDGLGGVFVLEGHIYYYFYSRVAHIPHCTHRPGLKNRERQRDIERHTARVWSL